MFIIELNYKASIDVIDQFIVEHRLWLDKLYAENKLLCSGPKNPRNGGIIIALGDKLHEIKDLITHDPFYIQQIAEYTITEFHPNKLHKNLHTSL